MEVSRILWTYGYACWRTQTFLWRLQNWRWADLGRTDGTSSCDRRPLFGKLFFIFWICSNLLSMGYKACLDHFWQLRTIVFVLKWFSLENLFELVFSRLYVFGFEHKFLVYSVWNVRKLWYIRFLIFNLFGFNCKIFANIFGFKRTK